MRIGGLSVMGTYHDKNQDSFLAEKTENGWLAVVSDGVGSCKFSEIGSALACQSVKTVIGKFGGIPENADLFFKSIHSEWLSKLAEKHENAEDCCATLLFCYCTENRIFAARLGDGFVGICADGMSYILFDDKFDHMANETDSLFEKYVPEAWEAVDMEYAHLLGIFVSTDGLSVFPHERETFVSLIGDLLAEYSGKETGEIKSDMSRWMSRWNSSDDKTMVFMIGE